MLHTGDRRCSQWPIPTAPELFVVLHNLSDAKRRAELELPGAIDARLNDILGEREVELSGQRLR